MKSKPSEIFEGENSSLRRTFYDAVKCDFCGGTGKEWISEDESRPCPKCQVLPERDDLPDEM